MAQKRLDKPGEIFSKIFLNYFTPRWYRTLFFAVPFAYVVSRTYVGSLDKSVVGDVKLSRVAHVRGPLCSLNASPGGPRAEIRRKVN